MSDMRTIELQEKRIEVKERDVIVNNFDPDKRIDVNNVDKSHAAGYNPDKRIEVSEELKYSEKILKDYFVDLKEKSESPEMREEFDDKRDVKTPIHIPTINEKYEGQKYPGTNVEYRRRVFHVDGEKVEGVFPIFESKFDTSLPKDLRKASDVEQFSYCTKELTERIEKDPSFAKNFTQRQLEQIKNGEPRISGLTWHHNEITGKMQLVNAELHAKCRHTGGKSIWGGGTSCR